MFKKLNKIIINKLNKLEYTSNIEMVKEMVKFLKKLFKGDEEKLKELFEIKDKHGKTALDINPLMKKHVQEKFNIMSDLDEKVSI